MCLEDGPQQSKALGEVMGGHAWPTGGIGRSLGSCARDYRVQVQPWISYSVIFSVPKGNGRYKNTYILGVCFSVTRPERKGLMKSIFEFSSTNAT